MRRLRLNRKSLAILPVNPVILTNTVRTRGIGNRGVLQCLHFKLLSLFSFSLLKKSSSAFLSLATQF